MKKNETLDPNRLFNQSEISLLQRLNLMISSTLINVLGLTTPIILMQIYDRIIAYQNKSTLITLVTGGSIAIIIETILKQYREKLITRITSAQEYSFSVMLLEKLLKSKNTELKPSKLIESIESLSSIKQIKVRNALKALYDLPFFILYLIVLYYLSKPIAYYNLFIAMLTMLSMYAFTLRDFSNKKELLNLKTKEQEFQIEALLKKDIIKKITLESKITRNYSDIKGKILNNQHKENIFISTVNAATQSLSIICVLGTVLVGAYYTIEGKITIGGLTACTLISGKIMTPVFNIVGYFIRIPELNHRLDEVNSFIKLLPTQNQPSTTIKEEKISIKINTLNVIYNEKKVFDSINFSFDPNGLYVLDDFNAQETYTLFENISKHKETNINKVFINGKSINKINQKSLRENIFHISKEGDFFHGTILENISIFSNDKDLAKLCASLLSLDQYYNYLPDGYETVIKTERLDVIPMSLIHRIQIARALYFHPKVLLIDKIDQDLDVETLNILKTLIKKLKKEIMIIIDTDSELIRSESDYILKMDNGKMIIEV